MKFVPSKMRLAKYRAVALCVSIVQGQPACHQGVCFYNASHLPCLFLTPVCKHLRKASSKHQSMHPVWQLLLFYRAKKNKLRSAPFQSNKVVGIVEVERFVKAYSNPCSGWLLWVITSIRE